MPQEEQERISREMQSSYFSYESEYFGYNIEYESPIEIWAEEAEKKLKSGEDIDKEKLKLARKIASIRAKHKKQYREQYIAQTGSYEENKSAIDALNLLVQDELCPGLIDEGIIGMSHNAIKKGVSLLKENNILVK